MKIIIILAVWVAVAAAQFGGFGFGPRPIFGPRPGIGVGPGFGGIGPRPAIGVIPGFGGVPNFGVGPGFGGANNNNQGSNPNSGAAITFPDTNSNTAARG
ncbi:elastin-like [Lucilia sericata]|uniref:elastin-like n=1 Tax=Lucilia sericata TaxID=13632 RepID=UPI0018A86A9D|nr:elastin-like [Lucilia sericata]